MANYKVLEEGVEVNRIVAEEAYMAANYAQYELVPLTEDQINAPAIQWRNGQLQATDFIVPTTDFPDHAAWITYREELRVWPDDPETTGFPDTRPEAPGPLLG